MDDVVLVEGLVTSLSVGDLDNDGQDDIVVGRAGYPFDPGGYQPGSVAVVSGPVFGVLDLVSTSASALVVGNVDTSWLGNSVDAEGDLDGDGVVDLVAGAPGPSSGTGDGGGAAYIFFGPVTGDLDVEQADASFVGPSDQEALVGVVVSTGDINGDGSDDLLVGAGVSSSGEEDTMVYLFEGPIAGQLEPSDALARVKSSNLTDWGIWDTQLAIDAGGDVNGDGVDDLLIAMKTASPDFDGYLGGIGYLLFSPYSHEIEIETQAGMVVDGENGPTHMGYAVSLGDADGDQFADAIFGATEGVQDRGYGYFFPGSGAVGIGQITTDAVSITLEGADVGSCAGYQAVLGKDINGDGYGDLLIGALYTDGDPDAPGLTHLVLGKVTTSLDLSQADGTFIGPVGTHWNSIALASGDLDADGIDDIIMASDPEDQGDLSVSTISVVYGGS